jgi:uncharacterized protein
MKKTKPVARPHHPPERGQEEPRVAGKTATDERPFWRRKSLSEMTAAEWESLCDGCGRCCLNKVEEEESGRIYYTDVGCTLLDGRTCRCKDYPNRSALVSDCVRLTPDAVAEIRWLPPTCGYRLVAEGRDLHWWHPLVSGDPDTVHTAGVSVRGRVGLTEDELGEDDDYEDHIVSWPLRVPAGAKRRP